MKEKISLGIIDASILIGMFGAVALDSDGIAFAIAYKMTMLGAGLAVVGLLVGRIDWRALVENALDAASGIWTKYKSEREAK